MSDHSVSHILLPNLKFDVRMKLAQQDLYSCSHVFFPCLTPWQIAAQSFLLRRLFHAGPIWLQDFKNWPSELHQYMDRHTASTESVKWSEKFWKSELNFDGYGVSIRKDLGSKLNWQSRTFFKQGERIGRGQTTLLFPVSFAMLSFCS